MNSSIWPIDRPQTSTTTLGHSGPGSNKRVLQIPQTPRLHPHHQMQFNAISRTHLYDKIMSTIDCWVHLALFPIQNISIFLTFCHTCWPFISDGKYHAVLFFNGISTFVGYLIPKPYRKAMVGWLGLWHINLCRLYNAKPIFIQINNSISNNSV